MLWTIIIGILAVCVAFWIINLIPIPQEYSPWFKNVLYIIVLLICLAWLLDIGGFANLGFPRWHK
jgi:hypothetical protein